MSDTYEFYKERHAYIGRLVQEFFANVPVSGEEQTQIIHRFALGVKLDVINSIQQYNNDLLIKGYEKVDIRSMTEPLSGVKGKFLDTGHFLKETMVQLPMQFFELKEEELDGVIRGICMEMAADRIKKHIQSLRMQKIQIEEDIARYLALLEEYHVEL